MSTRAFDAGSSATVSAMMDSPGTKDAPETQEWVVTTTNGLVTKVERLDPATQGRTELTREEYAGLLAADSYYPAYFSGIRDYAGAIASGNLEAAQAYYKVMADYFAASGQP